MKKIIALFILLSIFITGCSSGPDSANSGDTNVEKKMKDTFTVVLKGEPSNLDPHGNTQLVAFATQREIFNTLVQKDSDGNIVPELATKWEVIDDTTVRFYLREDVYFHDGEKLTAEDVKFSIDRATKRPSSASVFSSFDGEGTTVVDEYTVDVKVKTPFAPIYNYLASSRGAIVSKKAVTEMGDDEFGRNPVGTGPFKFKEWKTGMNITLEKNNTYWGEQPQYSNLVLKFITEPANRSIELETGGADAIFDVDPNDVQRLSENQELKVLSGPGYKITYITLSMADEILQNEQLREALIYALDIESMVDAVFGDSAEVADSVMAPTVFGYKSVGVLPYDPEKAKQLLKEAGYENGLDLQFKVSQIRDHQDIAEIAQNMWKEIGIETEVQVLDQAAYIASGASGELQIGMSSSTPTTGDPGHALFIWDSNYKTGQLHANDPKIDEYLIEGAASYDPEKRARIYGEAQEYIWNTHYSIPIAFSNVIYATGNHVENFDCNPGNTPDLAKVVVYEK